jgi:hypothetical protein
MLAVGRRTPSDSVGGESSFELVKGLRWVEFSGFFFLRRSQAGLFLFLLLQAHQGPRAKVIPSVVDQSDATTADFSFSYCSLYTAKKSFKKKNK